MDRQAFFAAVRKKPFGGKLLQTQVDGLSAMLDMIPPGMEVEKLAYCFATAHHETGGSMNPRVESLYYTDPARIKKVWNSRFPTAASAVPYLRNEKKLAAFVYGGRLGNQTDADAFDFRGMGLVQATGKDNAIRGTKRLRELGYLEPNQSLVDNPSLMLDPDIAAAMLFVGLSEGWYTGKRLGNYFGPGVEKPFEARAMVNADKDRKENDGITVGQHIVELYVGYKAALLVAGYKPFAVAPSVPTPPVRSSPVAPIEPAPATGQIGPETGASAPPGASAPSGFSAFLALVLKRLRAAYPPKG